MAPDKGLIASKYFTQTLVTMETGYITGDTNSNTWIV
ncbi:MAG: hypothetical protein BWY67_01238 [Bacteroidetes bacterium ADurb.Bin397]|nr:MAG: hypothetical protein BWY67_01238 [Bacteroidetes bacterium ADurb.Bin397]